MKKIITFICALPFADFSNAQAPDSWTEKNAIGQSVIASSSISARSSAVSFSIGTKGYVGTGVDNGSLKNDFWEYDPAANIWTQKANFAGAPRKDAVGFSIGTKGYIGTGTGPTVPDWFKKDFWEYDPAANTWTQRADFGGTARNRAIGISNGTKGYIGTGQAADSVRSDFWEYDPFFNSWIQMANFGGGPRYFATGFNISSNVYVGTGYYNGTYFNDFWKYNPSMNTWTQQVNFGGSPRLYAVGFNIGNKGYIGSGFSIGPGNQKDLWEYDPSLNIWTQKANFGTIGRRYATGFSIGLQGYIGMGYDVENQNDIWEYNSSANTWIQKNNLGVNSRTSAVGFDISGKGYIGTGSKKDFWEFDPAVNIWTQKADFGGTARSKAAGFNIGNKGYIGTGNAAGAYKNDFWEYNPSANTWTQKANFSGTPRSAATGFSIGNKGYIGTGSDAGSYKNDFWEYDPTTNVWTQKADFAGLPRNFACGFSIGNKGYLGTGKNGADLNDFWEYDPLTNSWTQKTNFGGAARQGATGFSLGDKGYIGTGYTQNIAYYNDIWEYNPSINTWTQRANFGGSVRYLAVSFSIKTKGYLGTGSYTCDLWEYTPICSTPVTTIYASGNTDFCNGDSVFLYANNGYNYQWKKNGVDVTGATSYFYYAKTTGNYTCDLTNSCSGVTSSIISVTVNSLPSATITPAGPTTFCSGNSVLLNANTGIGLTYQWKKNGTDISGEINLTYTATTAGSYTVVVTNPCGSATSSATTVTVNSLPSATITPAGPTTFCSGGSVVLNAPVAANRTYQWKKGANLISGATLSSYTATTGGNYRVIVTNTVTGCSKTSGSATIVTVNALPAATITPQGPTTFCAGDSVVLAANTGAGLTYKWKKGGGFISGATLSNYTATTGGNYRVEVTNSNGCSKVSGLVAVSVPCKEGDTFVSVPIAIGIDVKVFPNPSSGDFVFEFLNVSTEEIAISVYDMVGKLVLSENTFHSQFTIRNPQLAPGIYSAEIIYRGNKKVVKLVKTN
ncbi:MAG TPA: kelch repeat-containing protein [Bacteroidia bacterium]|nr:kelch repeat-containing protein [Bacteroidia bacterium]